MVIDRQTIMIGSYCLGTLHIGKKVSIRSDMPYPLTALAVHRQEPQHRKAGLKLKNKKIARLKVL